MTIFRSNKDLRVAGKPMIGLNASTILDKKTRPKTDYLPDRNKSPSFKSEKESKGV